MSFEPKDPTPPGERDTKPIQRVMVEADEPDPAYPEPRMTPEDPRELAQRLAAEAKARIERERREAEERAAAPPEPTAEERRELARKLAMEAKQRLADAAPPPASRAPAPAPKPTPSRPPPAAPAPPPPKKKSSLASRTKKPVIYQDALEAVRAATPVPAQRATSGPTLSPAPPRPAPPPPPEPAPAPAPPPPEPEPVQAAPEPPKPKPKPKRPQRPQISAAAQVLDLLPGGEVEEPQVVARREVFAAVWQAHRVRALSDGDYAMVATASVLIDAATRVPVDALVAARVGLAGKPHAVWVDLDRRAVLGIAAPADTWLVGI